MIPAVVDDFDLIFQVRWYGWVASENLGKAEDSVEGGSEFVAYRSQKNAFCPVCFLCFLFLDEERFGGELKALGPFSHEFL
ncbi:MAG: hypothetical protein BWY82_02291 [Verrucomicrobia bacterium ADurb.Bin474]|nr:MAG: hypothetical protein BWY82_02291 [Verrucomicrobia bacterium ADurb.Bin474]